MLLTGPSWPVRRQLWRERDRLALAPHRHTLDGGAPGGGTAAEQEDGKTIKVVGTFAAVAVFALRRFLTASPPTSSLARSADRRRDISPLFISGIRG